jgi:hypothetical protein
MTHPDPKPQVPTPPEPGGSQPQPPASTPPEPAGSGGADIGAGEPDTPRQQPPSGLRNPQRAVRTLGAMALGFEALALLLAIAPLRMLGGPYVTAAIISVVVLAGVAVLLAALLRYRATWYVVGLLNLAVTLTGFFQWALGVLGVAFALLWWYVLHIRRTILRRD